MRAEVQADNASVAPAFHLPLHPKQPAVGPGVRTDMVVTLEAHASNSHHIRQQDVGLS